MKLNFFIGIIVLSYLFSTTLTAQTESIDKIKYGFAYGITVNDVFNHPTSSYNFKARLSPILFSAFVQLNPAKKWSFIGEIDYIHKGPSDYDINYLTISALTQYKLFKKHPNISVLLGGYGGYLFQYKIDGREYKHAELENYDIGIETGIDYTRKLNDNLDLYISPRIEVGAIRFSYTNHLSYQLKVGVKF